MEIGSLCLTGYESFVRLINFCLRLQWSSDQVTQRYQTVPRLDRQVWQTTGLKRLYMATAERGIKLLIKVTHRDAQMPLLFQHFSFLSLCCCLPLTHTEGRDVVFRALKTSIWLLVHSPAKNFGLFTSVTVTHAEHSVKNKSSAAGQKSNMMDSLGWADECFKPF